MYLPAQSPIAKARAAYKERLTRRNLNSGSRSQLFCTGQTPDPPTTFLFSMDGEVAVAKLICDRQLSD